MEVYLNGVLATAVEPYRRDYGELEIGADARAALRPGANLLAVHGRQGGGGQYVHVEPVERGWLGTAPLADLAFGWRPIGTGGPRPSAGERARLVDRLAAEMLDDGERARLADLRGRVERARKRPVPSFPAALVQERDGPIPPLHVHVRGSAANPGEEVAPAFPSVLDSALDPPPVTLPELPAGVRSSGRRRALAEWIASPENALFARVMANRLWQYHFGRGIVASANDFGELGDRPTHPELLDWLAAELIARGWSLKAMHRLIMGSSAYRMSSAGRAEALARDPANRLYWRFDMRRLGAEELRDSMLAMTGRLNLKLGGPSFYAPMPEAVLATSSKPREVWGRSPEEETYRRSVYIKVKRSLLHPVLVSFDFADTDASCPVRFTTTQPTQALGLLNGEFVHRQAPAFAARLAAEAGPEPADRVARAWSVALCRTPSAAELESALAYLRELQEDHGLDAGAALADLCLMVLNLNEFAYLD